MKSMTFEEASRNFDAVLDAMHRGETVIITRDGEPIARCVSERTIVERIAELEARYPTLTAERIEESARWIEENRHPSNFPDDWPNH